MKFILGKKIEMSQIFNEGGEVIPVTLVKAGPCSITQIKRQDKDGYSSAQIGFDNKKNLSKSVKEHLKGLENFRWLREFRIDEQENLKRGDKISVATFEVGDKIKITGSSKGKGFQGVVKRHGFHGSPASHGHKDQLRMPGSAGPTEPARVFKGKRMPGHMGNAQITVKNLEIAKIDKENNILYIKGAVPGARNGLIMITSDGELKVNQQPTVNTGTKENTQTETPGTEEAQATEKNENKIESPAKEATQEEPVTAVKKEETTQETPNPEKSEDKAENKEDIKK